MNTNLKQKVDRLPLTSDYVFKRIFTYKGSEGILKDFLESILEIDIEKIEILNPELPKDTIEGKYGVLDIKAQIDDNTIIDIEMQMANEYNISERSTTYMGKLISNQLQKGEDYIKLKKSVVINILNFNYYKTNNYHNIAHMKFENTNKKSYVNMGYKEEQKIVTENMEMHFIEMPKFKKKNPDTNDKINQWLWLIAGEEEKIKMSEKKNKKVKQAVELLDEVSMSKEEREKYEAMLKAEFNYKIGMNNIRQEGLEEGIKKGIREGKKEGIKESQLAIAKKLLKQDMEIGEIANITEVDIEKLKELKKIYNEI